MILATELESQRDRNASHITPTEDRVSTRHDDQCGHRVGLPVEQRTNLLLPGLIDPVDHSQGEILLVLELVIERSARIAGIASHPLEYEVPIAVARQAPRGRLEQGAPRACTAIDLLGAPTARGACGRRSGLVRRLTYMHACKLSSSRAERPCSGPGLKHEAPARGPPSSRLADPGGRVRLQTR